MISPELIKNFFLEKEALSPDGDSTTAPPSQSSEQSDGTRRRKEVFAH